MEVYVTLDADSANERPENSFNYSTLGLFVISNGFSSWITSSNSPKDEHEVFCFLSDQSPAYS